MISAKVIVTCAGVLGLSYFGLFNHVEPTEVGIARNWASGQITLMDRAGWYVTPPWVWVVNVPTHPIRVCVSTASRGYSAKLVRFEPRFHRDFILTEGWYYYWWYNRLSFNIGYSRDEEFRGFRDIARAYAFSAKRYPFFIVEDQYCD